jgi:hypothetical protein
MFTNVFVLIAMPLLFQKMAPETAGGTIVPARWLVTME